VDESFADGGLAGFVDGFLFEDGFLFVDGFLRGDTWRGIGAGIFGGELVDVEEVDEVEEGEDVVVRVVVVVVVEAEVYVERNVAVGKGIASRGFLFLRRILYDGFFNLVSSLFCSNGYSPQCTILSPSNVSNCPSSHYSIFPHALIVTPLAIRCRINLRGELVEL